jgi:hypothetical protein
MDIVLTSALVILIVGCVVGYSVRAKTGQSRDDVLTADRRREAIIPARTKDCLFLPQVVP